MTTLRPTILASLLALGSLHALPALALTDISDVPLSSASTSTVKPNVMFILDDSGSMAWDYMPNNSSNSPEYSNNAVGYRNHLCNYVYYNPAVDYQIPKDADGTDVYSTNQTAFTGAYANGFYCHMNNCASSTQSKTNLSTSFRANSGDSSQPAYYWKYLGDSAAPAWAASTAYSIGAIHRPTTANGTVYTVITAGTSGGTEPSWPTTDGATVTDGTVVWVKGILPTNSVCDTLVTDPDDGSLNDVKEICTDGTRTTSTCAALSKTTLWQKIIVGASSGPAVADLNRDSVIDSSDADERQNFANWYTYYRTRILMMKSSSGRALFSLGDNYRVGFLTIHPGTFDSSGDANGNSVSSSKFLKVADFDATQRALWFDMLYSQSTGSATPLRTALSVAGRYFAGKNDLINKSMVPAQADDPVQYSCQQNFSILTTDGYWNYGDGKQLNGSSDMTNQDGVISELDAYNPSGSKFAVSPRPIYDGASSVYTWNALSKAYQVASCVLSTQVQERVVQWQRRQARFYRCKSNGTSCQVLSFDCSSGTGSSTRPLCKITNDTGWVNQATCSAGFNYPTTTLCRTTSDTGWYDVGSCTYSAPSGGPETSCRNNDVSGYKLQYRTTTTSTTYPGPGQSGSPLSGPICTTGGWIDVDGTCHASAPAIPGDGSNGACPPVGGEIIGAGPPSPPTGCTDWPCETSTASGGSSNTLADVAQYYYKTDLRTSALGNCTGALGVSVCDNNVPSSGTGSEDDRANWQHMTTFTMGLGLSGTLNYSPSYRSDTTGTFADLRTGAKDWPVPPSGGDDPKALDDLWHAAVNGRGQYFSARDPNSVIDGLQSALSGISARVASAAAAATSNLEPVAGDNFAYTAKYVTQRWTGELEAHEIDLATGAVSGTAIWSAVDKLAEKTKSACDNRDIKLFRNGAVDNLVDFKWNSYACDVDGNPTGSPITTLSTTEKAHFDDSGADTLGLSIDEIAYLSQYPNMTDGSGGTVDQRTLARGANLVNFLRGQRGKEGFDSGPPATSNDANKLFRPRDNVLGDIISAQPIFVRAPFAEYTNDTDPGYAAFRTAHASRTPMVYVAANDGMLHAFYAGNSIVDTQGGVEAWAFMPTMVLPNLYKLASENYATQHVYSVDGTPTAADVFDTTASADCASTTPSTPEACWKTILVGGLNKGGQGYYALDITDPDNPKGLWEFKRSSTCITVDADQVPTSTSYADCHIGYTYNNPIVGKLANGRWVVIVTSGYNNDDGIGYLYVLDAIGGEVLYRISTGVGDAANPSGLNHINAWVDNALFDNTIQRVYGVDMLGNVWRFDINDAILPSGREATLVAQVVAPDNTPQPITTKPELAEVAGAPYVFVASGRYLGTTDTAPPYQTQTVWAIKDPLSDTPLSNLRSTLSARTINNVGSGLTAYRTVTAASCEAPDGWYADLPDSGERVNIDMKLQLGTLIVPSNVPSTNACNIGGYGWLNYFNYRTGCAVSNSSNASVGVRLVGATGTESLAVGINVVRLPNGKTVVIATTSAAEQITLEAPFDTPPPVGKRVSWREIIQ